MGARDQDRPRSEAVEVTGDWASLIDPHVYIQGFSSPDDARLLFPKLLRYKKYLNLRRVHILGRNIRLSLLDVGLRPPAVGLAS